MEEEASWPAEAENIYLANIIKQAIFGPSLRIFMLKIQSERS